MTNTIKYFKSLNKLVKSLFWVSIVSLLVYNFYTKIYLEPYNEFAYNAGEFYIRLCYSILAAIIFYFINQHVPRQIKKEKTLRYVYEKLISLNKETGFLFQAIKISEDTNSIFSECGKIVYQNTVTDSEEEYKNWDTYLRYKVDRMNYILNEILSLYEYIDDECYQLVIETKQIVNDLDLYRHGAHKHYTLHFYVPVFDSLYKNREKIFEYLSKHN